MLKIRNADDEDAAAAGFGGGDVGGNSASTAILVFRATLRAGDDITSSSVSDATGVDGILLRQSPNIPIDVMYSSCNLLYCTP